MIPINKVSRQAQEQYNSKPFPRQIAGATLGIILLMGWSFPGTALARDQHRTPPTKAEVAEKQDDLQALRGQIRSLRKGVATAEVQRTDAADQLKGVEQEISATLRALHELTAQRMKQQDALNALGIQSRELESHLNSQQAQLEKLVYRQYLLGRPDSLRLLLNGDDPNQMARDLHYLTVIGRARSQLLTEIKNNLQRKQTIAAETRERAEAVATIEARQKEQHGQLVAQREKRKGVLEKISASIAQQRRQISNLQRDEKQLSNLVTRLVKTLAKKTAPPRHQADKTKPQVAGTLPAGASPQEIRNENTPEATPNGSFTQLKGSLRLPTRGVVSNRFGGPRQEGSAWKGLFIRSNPGNDVKAIAAGRVVFADWMRGFGNLMIIDHGSSYLSIYGNNDALLKQVGDVIRGGETIAAVGNSGGNPESGLYFELRHDGQPLDPLKWVNVK
ncbi:MAG: peptidoglycan DD-metalloendopeptidase family protein [Propionivibrio sp.]|uniref:murein hydrolase activator EnvC family protein n=1 Tax=Propionivibrio sp. TaxID=2212460 RepID=UPI0025D75E0D|nr:peptidoglycan DD-metalloendopeptidase family protein [Propionivibrio sp.]MBK8894626.1 peptidoglycan DD-metalloendopeptidase family protein [Propionivibrio sp.]MBL0207109.1 peptidoglycan DD-metalloendopeptidase family protein [Propionivibrio sp.]